MQKKGVTKIVAKNVAKEFRERGMRENVMHGIEREDVSGDLK